MDNFFKLGILGKGGITFKNQETLFGGKDCVLAGAAVAAHENPLHNITLSLQGFKSREASITAASQQVIQFSILAQFIGADHV